MKVKQSTLNDVKKLSQYNSFFHGFSKETLKNSLGHIITYHYHENKIIFMENGLCDRVYFIVDGWIKICTRNIKGEEITFNIAGKGEIVGEISAVEEIPRSADVVTLTKTTVMAIPESNFLNLLQTDTLASIRLAQLMSKRLRQTNQLLQLRDAGSLFRVASTLFLLAENLGEKINKQLYVPNLPHSELASITGLRRETISRMLSKLEQNHLIFRGTDKEKIYIPNLNALKELIN